MLNLCTTFDKNYLLKGLALHKSLCNTMKGKWILHILALDEECYEKLKACKLPHVILHSLKALEEQNPQLQKYKAAPAKSLYGNEWSWYVWALTPFFTFHVLNSVKTSDYVMYVDSDIFFYQSPETIIETMAGKSIGIHTQRFSSYDVNSNPVGEFNVGVVVFKRDTVGYQMCHLWASWLLDPSNEYYKHFGTCGDQKYLDLFIPIAGKENVSIFDREGGIHHKAPWCTHEDGGKPLSFFHFSHFNVVDFEQQKWRDNENNEWNPTVNNPAIQKLYQDYFNCQFDLHVELTLFDRPL